MSADRHPWMGMGRLARQEVVGSELPVRTWPERRAVVLGAAALLLIAVFLESMLRESAVDEFSVLYVLPVMLVGLELGVAGGLGAAALAAALLTAGSSKHAELGALGLAAAAAVFVSAGGLAGRFSTRMRAGQRRQARLLASGLRLASLDDLDVLPAVLAEELERVLAFSSLRVYVRGAPPVELGAPPSDALRISITARGIEFGSMALSPPLGRSFSAEDRVVAAKLARQAAVAADNQRLLASEREKAAMRAELEHTRGRLTSHLRNVGRILDDQDAERREIARQLHEQAAQAMTAVLLGLQVLERDLDPELTRKQVEEVRGIVRDTLAGVRQLAVSVRPPSLEDLGLRAALEGVAERDRERTARAITLRYEEGPRNLAPEVETCVYQLLEDAIRAVPGPLDVRVSLDHDGCKLHVELHSPAPHEPEHLMDDLAAARARVELTGGTLELGSLGGTVITSELPLDAAL